MPAIDTSEIRSLPVFAGVSDTLFEVLIGAALLDCFPSRATLAKEGKQANFLHVLLEGSVELFAEMEEDQTTITVLRPVTAFILPAVVGGLPYLVSARTLKPARILMIRAEAVRSAFAADPAFARAIVCELSRGFRRLLGELKNQKLRSSTERLADWLLRANARLGNGGRFTLPFDKRTLASRLGMTPENLSRNLRALSGCGVVVHGREVMLTDPAGLANIARSEHAADEAEF
jgi:CRP/FNR family transcriptional activator FtrB